jgi:hypothetical protein
MRRRRSSSLRALPRRWPGAARAPRALAEKGGA